jgi:hypothetical protein
MNNIASYFLANSYSAFSSTYNVATAVCQVNGQTTPCPDLNFLFGPLVGVFAVVSIVALAVMILVVVSFWKIFTKAGQPGWASLIPIYNMIVLIQIVRKPVWWILLYFIPGVNIVIAVLIMHDLAKAFGKDILFTIGLFILPIIFYPILAFGDATYTAPDSIQKTAPTTPAA